MAPITLRRRKSGIVSAKIALNVLERMAKSIPVFGEQVFQLVKVASDIVGVVEKHKLNQAANDELAWKVIHVLQITTLALGEPGVVNNSAPRLKEDLKEIEITTNAIYDELKKHYALHGYERFIMALTDEDTDLIRSLSDRLDFAMRRFNFKAEIQMRLGLGRVQDMLQMGLLDIHDIRRAVAVDCQTRRSIDSEQSKVGPCTCRRRIGEHLEYDCKHCLLEAIIGQGEAPLSEEELHFNNNFFGAEEAEEPMSYASETQNHPHKRSNKVVQEGMFPKERARSAMQGLRYNLPPRYSLQNVSIAPPDFKPRVTAPPMYGPKEDDNSKSRGPPSMVYSLSGNGSDDPEPLTPTDTQPTIRTQYRTAGGKIAFPMPSIPLFR